MMLKVLHALDALRVSCIPGSRCMIALCDLTVKQERPDGAVQACASLTCSSHP